MRVWAPWGHCVKPWRLAGRRGLTQNDPALRPLSPPPPPPPLPHTHPLPPFEAFPPSPEASLPLFLVVFSFFLFFFFFLFFSFFFFCREVEGRRGFAQHPILPSEAPFPSSLFFGVPVPPFLGVPVPPFFGVPVPPYLSFPISGSLSLSGSFSISGSFPMLFLRNINNRTSANPSLPTQPHALLISSAPHRVHLPPLHRLIALRARAPV